MRRRPEGHPSNLRSILSIAILIVAGHSLCLAGSAPEDGTTAEGEPGRSDLRLRASRAVGFAPLRVEVSGSLRDGRDQEIEVESSEGLVLQVEASHFRVVGSDRSTPIVRKSQPGVEEEENRSTGPMNRSLVLHQPGTYTLRLVMDDGSGGQILSNAVKVRVL